MANPLTLRLEVAACERSQLVYLYAHIGFLDRGDHGTLCSLPLTVPEDAQDQLRVDGVEGLPEPLSVSASTTIGKPLVRHTLAEIWDAGCPIPPLVDGELRADGDVKVLHLVPKGSIFLLC